MTYNKGTGERMEQAAKEAYQKLQAALANMNEHEIDGAYVVIDYFKNNYMTAGYKKLARKLVKEDINA